MLHDPGGLGFRIETLWAYLAVHDDGDEGVIAASIGGVMMPLVAADEARLRDLRPYAEQVVALTGKAVRLVRFDHRVVEEVLGDVVMHEPTVR